MVVKYLGRDCELSTTGVDADGQALASWNVASRILEQIGPVFRAHGAEVWSREIASKGGCYPSSSSMDCLRNWTSNGQCYYSDMGHVEVCTAPTSDPRHFASQCIFTLCIAEQARKYAEAQTGEDAQYSLSAANADAYDPSISWGTHLNISVSTPLWEDLCLSHRHPAVLGFVASALAAAVPFFGAGYLLPMRDGSMIYSLSGRAHHLSQLKTLSTTEAFCRGLLNTRREPWGADQDRLHLIGFDYSILSAAMLGSLVQSILAAAEEGYCRLNIYDPVRALRTWSWGLDTGTCRLAATAATVDGRKLTLPAYVGELASTLLKMCEDGLITHESAPDAPFFLSQIIALARYAEEGSFIRCAQQLDWAAKLMWLLSAGHAWGSAAARIADHDFANTDPEQGILWRLWEEGLVDPLVTMQNAWACLADGPVETCAWARGRIIRKFSKHISNVNWDYVELYRNRNRWWPRLRIDMPRIDSLNQETFGPIIQSAQSVAELGVLVDANTPRSAQDSDPVMDLSGQLAVPGDGA
ncbi:MAG: proteasome accessory factor PafA2 family protein [Pirellulales bacterium]|nr:proteasome accessory factor PafA2 family protein [Pirellulales bacterium]